ncbi:Putative zinc transporter msc2 [Yamadazyma tenuis]|uniref:Putative zinc transporter msc2 n=1 Tax=Candida tenuis TaxID=2315449 RepID=UPI00279B2D29|nr:Putative zinc transporter msc2 [Yamadazyma tenuis]
MSNINSPWTILGVEERRNCGLGALGALGLSVSAMALRDAEVNGGLAGVASASVAVAGSLGLAIAAAPDVSLSSSDSGGWRGSVTGGGSVMAVVAAMVAAVHYVSVGRVCLVAFAVFMKMDVHAAMVVVADLIFRVGGGGTLKSVVAVAAGYVMAVVAAVVADRVRFTTKASALAFVVGAMGLIASGALSVPVAVAVAGAGGVGATFLVVFIRGASGALGPGSVPVPGTVCAALVVAGAALEVPVYHQLRAGIDLLMVPLWVGARPYPSVSQTVVGAWGLVKELIHHPDTKAIFNFLLLNSVFMVVQLVYSFRSGSLGLFSDSLHMALDCSSLALGLVAGILSKSPVDQNSKFPFGYSRFETLAGFTNGTLLIGISGGIVFEAVARLYNPIELKETTELIVVSVLGLVVNLVGIFAFNHGHSHGDSHSHGHSHGHSHSHTQSSNSYEDGHGSHSHEHSHSEDPHPHEKSCDSPEKSSSMNDNMRGIFLHILADTLGSVGVVVSTILTKVFHWEGFDPIASIIIAVLIFFSAIPLIKSTSSALLLSLNKDNEMKIRGILQDVSSIKGVKSFTTPRFWPSPEGMTGYIHIQVYRGENASYIKKQCMKHFDIGHVEVIVQMEYDYDECWCRH